MHACIKDDQVCFNENKSADQNIRNRESQFDSMNGYHKPSNAPPTPVLPGSASATPILNNGRFGVQRGQHRQPLLHGGLRGTTHVSEPHEANVREGGYIVGTVES